MSWLHLELVSLSDPCRTERHRLCKPRRRVILDTWKRMLVKLESSNAPWRWICFFSFQVWKCCLSVIGWQGKPGYLKDAVFFDVFFVFNGLYITGWCLVRSKWSRIWQLFIFIYIYVHKLRANEQWGEVLSTSQLSVSPCCQSRWHPSFPMYCLIRTSYFTTILEAQWQLRAWYKGSGSYKLT